MSSVSNPPVLLPHDALKGVRLGVSVSESPDLARMGLLEAHFRLALGEIARCVVVSGGELAYGGTLHPDGYTSFLIQELQRYNRRDRPLRLYLSWHEHRSLTLSVLARTGTVPGFVWPANLFGRRRNGNRPGGRAKRNANC
jgi:hypothetical protein